MYAYIDDIGQQVSIILTVRTQQMHHPAIRHAALQISWIATTSKNEPSAIETSKTILKDTTSLGGYINRKLMKCMTTVVYISLLLY